MAENNDDWKDVDADDWKDSDKAPAPAPQTFTPQKQDFDPGAAATFGQHSANNVAFGLGNKAIGGIQALTDYLADKKRGQPGHGFGDAYDRALRDVDMIEAQGEAKHPVARWVGTGTGILTGGAMMPALGASKTVGQAITKGVTMGAGAGALQGAGSARGEFSNTVKGAAVGAGVGGLMGGFGGAAAYGASKAGSRVMQYLADKRTQKMAEAINEKVGSGATGEAAKEATIVRPEVLRDAETHAAEGTSQGMEADFSTQSRRGRQMANRGAAIRQAGMLRAHDVPLSGDEAGAVDSLLTEKAYPGLPKPKAAAANAVREASGPSTQILSRSELPGAATSLATAEAPALTTEMSTAAGRPSSMGKAPRPPTDRLAEYLSSFGERPGRSPPPEQESGLHVINGLARKLNPSAPGLEGKADALQAEWLFPQLKAQGAFSSPNVSGGVMAGLKKAMPILGYSMAGGHIRSALTEAAAASLLGAGKEFLDNPAAMAGAYGGLRSILRGAAPTAQSVGRAMLLGSEESAAGQAEKHTVPGKDDRSH